MKQSATASEFECSVYLIEEIFRVGMYIPSFCREKTSRVSDVQSFTTQGLFKKKIKKTCDQNFFTEICDTSENKVSSVMCAYTIVPAFCREQACEGKSGFLLKEI